MLYHLQPFTLLLLFNKDVRIHTYNLFPIPLTLSFFITNVYGIVIMTISQYFDF